MNFIFSKVARSTSLLVHPHKHQLAYCYFTTNACLCGKTALYTKNTSKKRAMKEASAFNKVFRDNSGKKKKKKWLDDLDGVFSVNRKAKAPSVGRQRRAQQLNVILYDEITRIMGSGEVGAQLIPLGFHITMVDIALDFSAINVRWEADGTERDSYIEEHLPYCEHELRRLLTSYRVIGNVPVVQFVKDKRASRVREVERLLDIADMGPDYERSSPGEQWKVPKPLPYQSLQETLNQAATHFKDDITTQVSPTGAMEVVFPSEEIEEEAPTEQLPIIADFADLKLTSQGYDVDRQGLASKVLQLKKQSTRRGSISGLSRDRILTMSDSKETTMDTAKMKDIKKLLAARKGKQTDGNVRKTKYKDHLSPWAMEVGDFNAGRDWKDNDLQSYEDEPVDFYDGDYDERY